MEFLTSFRRFAGRNLGFAALSLGCALLAGLGPESARAATALPDTGVSFKTCKASENFKNAYAYLKSREELPFNEAKLVNAAMSISDGCDGATERFKKVYELLSKSGFDQKRCYELARDFAHMTDLQTDNFAIFFKGLFLENKFDMDFETSYQSAMALSAFLPKDWQKVSKDFESFLEFCNQNRKATIPIQFCARWTLNLLKESDKFPHGIFASFEKINSFLENKKGLNLSVKNRLELISEIISYGPEAPDSFSKSLEWIQSKQGPQVSPQQAWRLALNISKNSLRTVLPDVSKKSE